MKSFLKRLMVGMIAFCLAFNMFAVAAFADTLTDKIDQIYSSMEDGDIRRAYLEATTYCVTDNSKKEVFSMPLYPEIYDYPIFLATKSAEGDYAVTFYPKFDTNKDANFISRNAAGVEVLYNLCQQAKYETAYMSDEEKMYYLMDFVSENFTYNSAYSNINATSTVTFFEKLNAGSGVCAEFCELYVIVGQYIGLRVRRILGLLNGVSHVWVRVYINGTNYDIEATKGEFLSYYTQNNSYEEKVRTNDYATNYYWITH